jgi:flagellar transcriptional activator FlhC
MSIANRIEQRLRTLALARDCALLGARVRTIHYLTGLPLRELKQLLFAANVEPPRGRPPDTRDWYHVASLPHRVDASILVATFERLRAQGFGAAEALVAAYRYYRSLRGDAARIGFDRAFDLAANTAGLWITRTACFRIKRCPKCHEFLDGLTVTTATNAATGATACPICKLVERVPRDARLAAALHSLPAPAERAIPFTTATDAPLPADPDIDANGGPFPGAPPPH